MSRSVPYPDYRNPGSKAKEPDQCVKQASVTPAPSSNSK